MIRSIAAALAAFALISFGVRAEEAAKAAAVESPKAEAAKVDAKEDKAEKKAEKKADKKAHKKAKADKKADK